ncbi:MAG: ABC transporter ATP-binding protein [Limnochordia bacterium]|jgi:multiple sugar transport system ATP-binding protein
MPSVSVRNLRVEYNRGKTVALDDFDLEVKDGEFCVFLGPSGCGKTTALLCIAGLIVPTDGEVKIGDELVTSVPEKVFIRPQERNIAMVFQEYALYPNMTVRGNMAFALENRKFPKDQIEKKVNEIAAMLGIEALLDRKPSQLSGGQRQRVALGRALVRDPSIFLLDEPLGNLDAKLREQVRFELKRIQRRLGVTTIYVTHDQTEAMTLADKIVLMQDGKVIQEGTPSELYRRPQNTFVAGFVGTPRINFLECTLSMDGGLPVFINEGIKFGADQALSARLQDGKRYILAIRPSDFTLTDPGDLNGIRGRVELMELLGDDLLVHFTVGEQILTAKLDAGVHDQIGDEVVVRIDPSNLHLFDGELQTRVG